MLAAYRTLIRAILRRTLRNRSGAESRRDEFACSLHSTLRSRSSTNLHTALRRRGATAQHDNRKRKWM